MKKNKILITGGTGFLGKNLANFLKDFNKVYISARNLKLGKEVSQKIGIEFIPMDICDFSTTANLINKIKPKQIIHCAASKYVDVSEKNPDECINTNIAGSSNIYKAARLVGCKDLIAISSDKASPPYNTIYGLSKAVMERQMILNNIKSNMNLIILRFGNMAWSTGSVFPIWEEMEKKYKLIKSTGVNMSRFIYKISDVLNLIYFTLKNTKKFNNSILIPSMKSAKIIDFLNEWKKVKGTNYIKIKNRPMDKIHESLLSNYEMSLVKKIKTKIGLLYQIKNFYNQTLSDSSIDSSNSAKLSNDEINDILINKPKIL